MSSSFEKSARRYRSGAKLKVQKALEQAHIATQLDAADNDPVGAYAAYHQSVTLLSEVMESAKYVDTGANQVDVDSWSTTKLKFEAEQTRMKEIHDTYVQRMELLALIYGIPTAPPRPRF